MFHATEKYAVHLQMLSWRILSNYADALFVVVVTCQCDNLQVLPPGHHLTLTVPDPLPSPVGHKKQTGERTSDSARCSIFNSNYKYLPYVCDHHQAKKHLVLNTFKCPKAYELDVLNIFRKNEWTYYHFCHLEFL